MTYFKIIQNNQVIDAGFVFLKWNIPHHKLHTCDINEGQFVQNYKQNKVYSAVWLKPAPPEADTFELAEVIIVSRQEYYDIIAQLDEGEEIVEPEEPVPVAPAEPEQEEAEEEAPMTIAEMRQVIKLQTEQITFLENCLMEMSEIVYS